MFSSKIRLLIGLFAFGAGILLFRLCFFPQQIERTMVATTQTSVSDARFEGVEIDTNLQKEADALLPLFDQMPPVSVYIKNEPILKSGTNTETSNAYTHCDKNQFPVIFIKKIYFENAHPTKLVNTLKHELTHAWLCRQQLMSVGHGTIFRQKLDEVGGWLNAE